LSTKQTETTTTPKLSKAEQSRINGAKSKGPVTEAGKARSAMNSLKDATHANVNLQWLPIDAGVLSNESRELAFSIFESYCRQLQPQSDVEVLLVKQITGHQCHLDRLLKVEAALLQCHLDQVMPNLVAQCEGKESALPNSIGTTHAFLHCVNADDKALRSLDRQRRSHERSIKECLRRLKELRKDFPVAIPDTADPEKFLIIFGLERCTEKEAEEAEEAEAAKLARDPEATEEAGTEEASTEEADMETRSEQAENEETAPTERQPEVTDNKPLTDESPEESPKTNLPKAA
jgi:hypothetical protein